MLIEILAWAIFVAVLKLIAALMLALIAGGIVLVGYFFSVEVWKRCG